MKKMAVITLFLLSGCDDVVPTSSFGLIRQYDKDTGVTCFKFISFEGISCIKLPEAERK